MGTLQPRPAPPLLPEKGTLCPCGALATHVLEWRVHSNRGGYATHRERRMCKRCADRAAWQLLSRQPNLNVVLARRIA